MNRVTLLKRLREYHAWLKAEAAYEGNPYEGISESMAYEAARKAMEQALDRFERLLEGAVQE